MSKSDSFEDDRHTVNIAEHTTVKHGGCWPSAEQRQLLRMCLIDTDIAHEYSDWRRRVDIDLLNSGSYRLLPLLATRLHQESVSDDKSDLIKGSKRLTWVRNQLRLKCLSEVHSVFSAADIPFIVLKGFALIIDGTYADPGLRPANDIDILIRPNDVEKAMRILHDGHWVQQRHERVFSVRELMTRFHASSLTRDRDEHLDLHWGAFHNFGQRLDEFEFLWQHARRNVYQAESFLTLSPTDQLLHTCVHGARWNGEQPIRWLADAHLIITRHHDQIDWHRFVQTAQQLQFTCAVKSSLHYLSTEIQTPVDESALQALTHTPVTVFEKIEHWFLQLPQRYPMGHIERGFIIWRMAREDNPEFMTRLRKLPYYIKLCLLIPDSDNTVRNMATRFTNRLRKGRAGPIS